MTTEPSLSPPKPTDRIASIDVFRGLTMLLMLFVNDIGDVDLGHIQNAPWWLKHMPGDVDGMTLADAIFPCFLFIVGLSIPIALKKCIAIGDSLPKLCWRVAARAMALIFIGLCMVNSCHGSAKFDEAAMGMSGAWWRILMFLGVILFWNKYPSALGAKKWLFVSLRCLAAALLIYLLAIYRAEQNGVSGWLRPSWWGIIGLIGWAYLLAAIVWLACRNHEMAIMGAFALFIALDVGLLSSVLAWWDRIVNATHGWLPSLYIGALASMVIAGIVVTTLFRPDSTAITPRRRIAWMLVLGAGFAAAGLLLRPFGGIHKNSATPAWIFCSLAIACAVYSLLYWLVDVKKISGWTSLIAPAGSNTLLMYMLPYIFYSLLTIFGITYLQNHFNEGWPGVARSAIVAVCLMGTTNLLTRLHIRLKV